MKRLMIGAAALMVALGAYGQGTVTINNRIGTDVTARFVLITDAAGTSSVGSPDFTVAFFGGPAGAAVSALVPLTPPTSTFRGAAGTAAAGFFNGVTATVPGVAPGANAEVVVRVLGPNGLSVDFGPFTANALGGDNSGGVNPPLTPPNLAMGTNPLLIGCPEPTTLALGLIGLGGLLAFRRRR